MEVGTTTLFALAVLIINGGIQWIRELRKGNGNGKDLKEIKDKIDCVDKKVGETKLKMAEVKTAVGAQKTQCAATVKRFDKTIADQNKELIALAKNGGRRS